MTHYDTAAQPSTTDASRTDAARDAARGTAHTAKDQAGQTAHSAAESGQHLAHEAKAQAKDVGREAGQQAKQLLGQGRDQLTTEASAQQQKLAGGLRAFSKELGTMAGSTSEPGLATDLAREVSDRVDQAATFFEDREPGELLGEVKSFAQRRPGTFLLLAAGAGLLAGRLTRGVKEIGNDEPGTGSSDAAPLTGTRTSAYGVQDTSTYGAGAATSGATAAPTTSTYGSGVEYGAGTAPAAPSTLGDADVPADPYGTGAGAQTAPSRDPFADAFGAGTHSPPSGAGQFTAGEEDHR